VLALVTGANGLVGRKLVEDLLAQGVEVRAMVRPGTRRAAPKGATVVFADLRDEEAVIKATQDCSWVYHCAASTHGAHDSLATLFAVNVEGSRNVAKAALANKVRRVVYTSTGAVYGRAVSRHDIDEETPVQPDSPYGESKLQGERVLLEFPDLPVVIVRTVTVWGPGMQAWAELFRVVADNRFRMAGAGSGMHTLTHIDDLSAGLVRCGSTPGVERQVYVMTGHEAVALRKLMQMMAEETGAAPIRDGIPEAPLRIYNWINRLTVRSFGLRVPKSDRLDFFLGDRTFNISKARRELGYQPQFSAREIVKSTADYLRLEGLLR